MTPRSGETTRISAGLVGTLAVVLGAMPAAVTAWATIERVDFVNPHAMLYAAFYGGGVLCPIAAAWVVRRLARRTGPLRLDAALVAVNVTWFCWFVGAWGLTAS